MPQQASVPAPKKAKQETENGHRTFLRRVALAGAVLYISPAVRYFLASACFGAANLVISSLWVAFPWLTSAVLSFFSLQALCFAAIAAYNWVPAYPPQQTSPHLEVPLSYLDIVPSVTKDDHRPEQQQQQQEQEEAVEESNAADKDFQSIKVAPQSGHIQERQGASGKAEEAVAVGTTRKKIRSHKPKEYAGEGRKVVKEEWRKQNKEVSGIAVQRRMTPVLTGLVNQRRGAQ